MAVQVLGTGVLIRLAGADEVRDFEGERHARGGQLGAGEVYVVSQAFVDLDEGDGVQRWVSAEHRGHRVSVVEDATMDLLRLAEETADDGLIEVLADLGIAGLGVSRWALMSAPRRFELEPALAARLAPLRRR